MLLVFTTCGRSSLVERQLPKLKRGVRFPSPAPVKQEAIAKAVAFLLPYFLPLTKTKTSLL